MIGWFKTKRNHRLKLINKLIKQWENEYGLSLKKENKQKLLNQEGGPSYTTTRLFRKYFDSSQYFIQKYGMDPPIINGDKMPLHRNESSQQKTITFKDKDTIVRKNHNLSRERVTVFTQVSSASTINLKPEFVFKG